MDNVIASKVKGLWLEANGSRIPLMSVEARLEMPAPSCTVVPIVGKAPLDGKKDTTKEVNALSIGTKTKVVMIWNGKEVTLFSGRVAYKRFDHFTGNYPTTSTFVPVINIGHNVLDLSSVAMTTMIFSRENGSSLYMPFSGTSATEGTGAFSVNKYNTLSLSKRQLAAHIVDILDAVAEWYQQVAHGGQALVKVKELVKPSTCTYREDLVRSGESMAPSILYATRNTIANSAMGKQTFYALLSALADYCMLSIIPRLNDVTLVPETVGFKPPEDAPVISRKYVTRVRYGESRKEIPINRVMVNFVDVCTWLPPQMANDMNIKIDPNRTSLDYKDVAQTGSVYPAAEKDKSFLNAVQASPPPILQGLLLGSLSTRGRKPSDEGTTTLGGGLGTADETVDQGGEVAHVQSSAEALTIGEATAKLLYGALAYSGGLIEVSMAFDGLLAHGKQIKGSDGSIYALLGKVITVNAAMPYEEDSAASSFVGYVNSVTVSVNTQAPSLGCTLTLSNVRPKGEDDKHSIKLSEHPLYSNVESAGIRE